MKKWITKRYIYGACNDIQIAKKPEYFKLDDRPRIESNPLAERDKLNLMNVPPT